MQQSPAPDLSDLSDFQLEEVMARGAAKAPKPLPPGKYNVSLADLKNWHQQMEQSKAAKSSLLEDYIEAVELAKKQFGDGKTVHAADGSGDSWGNVTPHSEDHTMPTINDGSPHYRTQKARGIAAIKQMAVLSTPWLGRASNYLAREARIVGAKELRPALDLNWNHQHKAAEKLRELGCPDAWEALYYMHAAGHEYFVRPCPVTPRHGFVESRIIKSLDALRELVDETLATDPEGEIIFMPVAPYKGHAKSAIISSAGVSFGRGNDGATSGKGSVLVPAPIDPKIAVKVMARQLYSGTHAAKTVRALTSPYIEMVESSKYPGQFEIVQLRDGPVLPASRNFLPKDFVVKEKIKLSAADEKNLLKWEAKIKAVKKPESAVVLLPGSTLASHFAVHAVARNIAVVTDEALAKSIEVGSKLAAEKGGPKRLEEEDFKRLAKYCRMATNAGRVTPRMAIGSNHTLEGAPLLTAITMFHSMASWDNSATLLHARAWSMAMMLRHLVAACIGEDRHAYRSRRALCPEVGPGFVFASASFYYDDKMNLRPKVDNTHGVSRNAVYREALEYRFADLGEVAADCCECFLTKYRGGLSAGNYIFHGGVGGPAWANLSRIAWRFHKRYGDFVKAPSAASWADLIFIANLALHTAHNNALVYTKWLGNGELNEAPVYPGFLMANPVAADLVLEPRRFYDKEVRCRNRPYKNPWKDAAIKEGLFQRKEFDLYMTHDKLHNPEN